MPITHYSLTHLNIDLQEFSSSSCFWSKQLTASSLKVIQRSSDGVHFEWHHPHEAAINNDLCTSKPFPNCRYIHVHVYCLNVVYLFVYLLYYFLTTLYIWLFTKLFVCLFVCLLVVYYIVYLFVYLFLTYCIRTTYYHTGFHHTALGFGYFHCGYLLSMSQTHRGCLLWLYNITRSCIRDQ